MSVHGSSSTLVSEVIPEDVKCKPIPTSVSEASLCSLENKSMQKIA